MQALVHTVSELFSSIDVGNFYVTEKMFVPQERFLLHWVYLTMCTMRARQVIPNPFFHSASHEISWFKTEDKCVAT